MEENINKHFVLSEANFNFLGNKHCYLNLNLDRTI